MKQMRFFFLYVLLLVISCTVIAGEKMQRFDSLSFQVEKNAFSHEKKTRAMVDEMYQIARDSRDSAQLIIQCIYRQAVLDYAQGIYDDSLTSTLHHYLKKIDKEKYPLEEAILYYSLSMNYTTKGDFTEAFSFSLKTLDKMKTLNDSLLVAKTLNILGNICSYTKINNMAIDYYKHAEQWVRPNEAVYYQIRNNKFRILFFEYHLESTIDSFLQLIPKIENFNDPGLLMLAYLNVGACYSVNGDFQKAYYYYSLSQELEKIVDNRRFTFSLYQNLGIYYFENENLIQAYQNLMVAKNIAEDNENSAQLSWALYNLAHVFYKMGYSDSAFLYLQEYQRLSAELASNSKTIEAYQAYVSVFLEASENRATIAEQEIELKNRRFVAVIIISIALFVFILMLLFVVQQQKRFKMKENKELSRRLEQEQKIKELQEEKHKETIESKTREITSYSLQLSNKNSILKQISDLTKQFPEGNLQVDGVNKKITDIVKSNLNADNDWKNFKIHFENVHPSFFDRLKIFCDELTETNLRLCAYFRIGMTTKQIAHILNISPESVTIHRHRLKKKLGLLEDENLDDFIRSI